MIAACGSLAAVSRNTCDSSLPAAPSTLLPATDLKELSVDWSEHSTLPPALAEATALRRLSLSFTFCSEELLTDAHVDWLLEACPSLREVSFGILTYMWEHTPAELRLKAALAEHAQE